MADFALANLNAIGGQSNRQTSMATTTGTVIDSKGGPALWSYVTESTMAEMAVSGYFNDASSLLAIGDLIYCVVASSAAVADAGFLVVMTNSAGVVDCSLETAVVVAQT